MLTLRPRPLHDPAYKFVMFEVSNTVARHTWQRRRLRASLAAAGHSLTAEEAQP